MTIPPKAKIYTKTGDKGSTRLVDGSCVEKFNPRVEAYGTVDELNSYLGVVRVHLGKNQTLAVLDSDFEKIQCDLFNIGSLLACADEKTRTYLPKVEADAIERLEKQIDQMTSELPELKNFILPAGHEASAHTHVARTLCRRAERRTAEVVQKQIEQDNTLIYLNRLSDYLFVCARWINLKMNSPEVLWKKNP